MAGNLLPTGSRPSAIARRNSRASQSVRPPAGASAMFSCRKSEEPEEPEARAGGDEVADEDAADEKAEGSEEVEEVEEMGGVMDLPVSRSLDLCTGPLSRHGEAMDMNTAYVHGYLPREARRLCDQADTLATLLHAGTAYPAGSWVLEVGCGVGAQTVHLARNSPRARIVAVDRSEKSLAQACAYVTEQEPGADVTWRAADLFHLPFKEAEFDHIFACFVLEHLWEPDQALATLRRLLRPGGTLTVIEGDHGSAVFHPDSRHAHEVIGHQVRLQAAAGGNALLGRELQPLLTSAGFSDVVIRPRTVYADRTRPALVDGFTRNTFIAMIESVRDDALGLGLTTAADWDRGITDLRRTAEGDGTFHYTFFKAVAVNPVP